jgi:HAD superfamily hydrolase (TIGR01509 family)
MIKAVIFDMDGVIIDSEPKHIKFEQELFHSLGAAVNRKEHLRFIGTTSQYMWDCIKRKYKLEQTVDELVRLDRDKYFEFLINDDSLAPISGVNELIAKLKKDNLKLAIASSSPIEVIKYVISKLGLAEYFDLVVTGDYVTRSKPYPDIFLYAAEKLSIEPINCLVIEDSENGVNAAKNADMKCLGFKNLNSGNQDLSRADMIIENFNEFNNDILV